MSSEQDLDFQSKLKKSCSPVSKNPPAQGGKKTRDAKMEFGFFAAGEERGSSCDPAVPPSGCSQGPRGLAAVMALLPEGRLLVAKIHLSSQLP